MIVLPVDIGPPIKGYSSAEAAIAAAQAHPRQGKARADGALLAGQSLLGGRASYSRWCLEFTGSLWVEIASQNDEVEWRVTRDSPVFEHMSEPYTLRWPSSDEVIDPAKLLSDRVGADFTKFWVSDAGFYVYLHRKLYLAFHSVRRVDEGTCVLAVYEEY